ncbi:MAG TPA: DUF1194 domain-containing protein [Methylomirabilota bacterium]|nr:DUF1194 domain-containing protein [Methylomirabilota bacterium]
MRRAGQSGYIQVSLRSPARRAIQPRTSGRLTAQYLGETIFWSTRTLEVPMRLAIVAVLLALLPTDSKSSNLDVDLALILAVDVSGSISLSEAALQREGYAAAIESEPVLQAIASGATGRIAVSYVEWSDASHQKIVIPWSIIERQGDASGIAASLRAGRPASGLNTSMATALRFAGDYLAMAPWRAERNVIDISGDGVSNSGGDLEPVRQALLSRGIVINGLPICAQPQSDEACATDLVGYYRDRVIGGPGSFIVTAEGQVDFATAVRTKIALEVANLSPTAPLQYADLRQ